MLRTKQALILLTAAGFITLIALQAANAPAAQAQLFEQLQQTPEVVQPGITQQPLPTLGGLPSATFDPFAGELTPGAVEGGLTPTPTPTFTPDPATLLFGEAVPVIQNARNDLEILATTALGGTQRPEGWSGLLDMTNSQMPLLLRLDLELLAGVTYSATDRPQGWFGPVPSTVYALSRDIRHDLELLADALGTPGVRPSGWLGDDPIMRCNRSTQALVMFLERSGLDFAVTADPNAFDFCTQAEIQASVFAEANLLRDPALAAAAAQGRAVAVNQVYASEFAVAFLDLNATRNVGQIPSGTPLEPVARSYSRFSRMMLVRGEGFEVFVQYDFTTISDEQYAALPDAAVTGAQPVCQAAWCR